MVFSPDQLAMLQTALTPPAPVLVASPQMGRPAPAVHPRPLSLPLWPVILAYPAFAVLLAVVSLFAPSLLLAAALVASPLLAVAVVLHCLSVPPIVSQPCRLCASVCVAALPLACWVAHPWPLWASASAFSCFFAVSAQGAPLRRASLWAFLLVLASGALVALRAPARLTWAPVLLTLVLQSVGATARLRRAALHCTVADSGSVAADQNI